MQVTVRLSDDELDEAVRSYLWAKKLEMKGKLRFVVNQPDRPWDSQKVTLEVDASPVMEQQR